MFANMFASLLPLLASASRTHIPVASPSLIAALRPFPKKIKEYDNDAMVYTYIDLTHASRGLASSSNTLDMLTLWAASWARHGWTPRVLTRDDVERDPAYPAFAKIANKTAMMVSRSRGHSTVVDATFRLRGLTQFFAKAISGAGVLTDSDVINYGLTPQDVRDSVARLPGGANSLVRVHDARNCHDVRSFNAAASGFAFRPEGYVAGAGVGDVDAAAAAARADRLPRGALGRHGNLVCTKTNNGLTSGTGAAYHQLVQAMLSFQQASIAKYSAAKDASMIGRMTEMRIINIIGPRSANGSATDHADGKRATDRELPPPASNGILAVAPVCVTFNAQNAAWRRAKAVHFYGSGITNWVRALCSKPEEGRKGKAAAKTATSEVAEAEAANAIEAWHAAGICNRKVSRAKFVRFLRDPLQ